MLAYLDPIRDFSLLSVTIRIVLSVICGGLIGLERERKRRPAGFRTHILICLGAAMTVLTSQYLLLVLHYTTDITRLGAQVVAGIGFIGAGTIIVTRRTRVKGLTTAAGLWTSAIVGLALGAGYYEGGIYASILVLIAEMLFSKLEYRILRSPRKKQVFIEYADRRVLDSLFTHISAAEVKISDLEVTRLHGDDGTSCAVLNLTLTKKHCSDSLLEELSAMDGVLKVLPL